MDTLTMCALETILSTIDAAHDTSSDDKDSNSLFIHGFFDLEAVNRLREFAKMGSLMEIGKL